MSLKKNQVYIGAPKPKNETQRLAALHASGLLDSSNDPEFDRIAKLAKDIFNIEVSLITFLDADRQWFKSCYGVDITETPRNLAFCGFTILQDDVLVIKDAMQDARVADNPLVLAAPFIKFYAGAPILSPDGFKLGSLCVIDTQRAHPDFGDREKDILSNLATLVSKLIATRLRRHEAEMASDAKTEFLSHISHELRTPLNALIGTANLLRRRDFEPQTANLVRTLHVTSESLLELINSVLDLSAIESRNFELTNEAFSWNAMFSEIETILSVRADEKKITFTADSGALRNTSCRGDRLRIKQLLINIIGNAVKFTPTGNVHFEANRHEGRIEFRVTDTGIGIPAEKLEEVFKPFVQGHQQNGQFQGTGLGLSITKQLVEKMGGEISVESTVGEGTRFSIFLPDHFILNAIEPAAMEPETTGAAKDQLKVLLAEDYPANVLVTSFFLDEFGYQYDVAEDGRQVLEKIVQGDYDAVLMDINMPEISGIEATRIIRQNPRLKHVKIIGMSGHVFERERLQCIEAGMDDYVTKPINYAELDEKIRYLTRK